MRKAEMLKLKFKDLDRMSEGGRRQITIQQLNTKTLRERPAPISSRLQAEFDRLRAERPWEPEDRVFGLKAKGTPDVKTAFASACRAAGIKDLRFHDLRRTGATRLRRAGMPIGKIARILGHRSIKTTYVYLGVSEDMTDRAAELFDEINREAEERRKKKGKASAPKGQPGSPFRPDAGERPEKRPT